MEVEEDTRRRPTPDHPPYSEMVQCAIRALAEEQGSTESAISAYIQAHYDSLPWAHSRLLPYYLNKLLLSREITESPLPHRYLLPHNPNPTAPRKRGRPRNPNPKPKPMPKPPNPLLPCPTVKRGRGRPRKKIRRPKPTSTGPGPSPSGPRPRLILKLKRSSSIVVDPQGGVCTGSQWHCLRREKEEEEEKNSAVVESNEHNEDDLDGKIRDDEREEDINGITIDGHYGELLALHESDLNAANGQRREEEFSELQEEELNGITIDSSSHKESKEHTDDELVGLQEKDSNGIEIDSSSVKDSKEHTDDEMVGLQEKDSDGIEIDGRPDEEIEKSDRGTSRRKAKSLKRRRLWYES